MRTSLFSLIAILSLGATTPVAAQNWSAELFGGVRTADTLTYAGTPFGTDSGSWVGLRGLWHHTPQFAFGLEYNKSEADYTGFVSGINSDAIMVIARYTRSVGPQTKVYGTLGLGQIDVEYDGSTAFPAFTGSDKVSGGQLTLGVHQDFGNNIGGFLELTYQDTFGNATIVGVDVEYNSLNLALGLSVAF